MIYWNQQDNPNLDFDKWDLSGIGENTEEGFKVKVKKKQKEDNKNNIDYEKRFVSYFKEFKRCLDLYEIPYSVDYLWYCNRVETISISIYYPEIIITNGKHQEKLLDLYFIIAFDETGRVYLKGTRETYTERHYKYNYTHSHLPGSAARAEAPLDFCLGSGVLASLKSILNSYFNPNDIRYDCIKGIIMNIKPYLEWESEAGGPYIRMSTIGIKKFNIENIYDMNFSNKEEFDSKPVLIRYICKNINYSKFKFRLENSNGLRLFKLVINKDFIDEIELVTNKLIANIDKINDISSIHTTAYKYINDTFYILDTSRTIDKSCINVPIFIRNHETIYRKVIKDKEDVEFIKSKKYNLPTESMLRLLITTIEYAYNYNAQLKIKNYNNNDRTISSTNGEKQIHEIN